MSQNDINDVHKLQWTNNNLKSAKVTSLIEANYLYKAEILRKTDLPQISDKHCKREIRLLISFKLSILSSGDNYSEVSAQQKCNSLRLKLSKP